MTKTWMKLVVVGLLLVAAAAPVAAQPVTIAPGNDGWVTPAGGSQIDLSIYPLDLIFGPQPTVNPTSVSLSGVPLDPANLGSIDTLLERYPPSVTFNAIGDVRTFPVEIKALRLQGSTNVNGTAFTVYVALSSVASGAGTITATLLTPDGGRFDSSFPVQPKLIFVDGFGNRSEIDCGLVAGCPANNVLSSHNNCWLVAFGANGFDPATKGITPIRAGIAVDADFNGANDYVTVGKKRAGFPGLEFHTGFQPSPPWNPCADAVHDHAVFSLTHVSRTPTDCKTRSTTPGSSFTIGGDSISFSRLCAFTINDTGTGTLKKQPAGAKKPAAKPRADAQKQ